MSSDFDLLDIPSETPGTDRYHFVMAEYSKTFTGTLTAPDGTVRHFINGALGKEGDLPAVEYTDGGVVYYCENPRRGGFGQRSSVEHRVGGPALIRANGDRIYYQLGKLHRDPDDGPAVILHTGVKQWFVNGGASASSRHRGLPKTHQPFSHCPP